jgi:hypothetical protein
VAGRDAGAEHTVGRVGVGDLPSLRLVHMAIMQLRRMDVLVGHGKCQCERCARVKTGWPSEVRADPRTTPSSEHLTALVNVPDAQRIAVVDLAAGKQVATWQVHGLDSNFPMAPDQTGRLAATVFRSPARLILFDARSGAVVANIESAAMPMTSSSTASGSGST